MSICPRATTKPQLSPARTVHTVLEPKKVNFLVKSREWSNVGGGGPVGCSGLRVELNSPRHVKRGGQRTVLIAVGSVTHSEDHVHTHPLDIHTPIHPR